jgi:hypothetical protein
VERRTLKALHHGEDDGVHGVQSVAHAFLWIETQFKRPHLCPAVGLRDDLICGNAGGGGGGLDFFRHLEVTPEEVVQRFHLVGPCCQGFVETGEINILGAQAVVAEDFPKDRGWNRSAEMDMEVVHRQ